MSAPGHYKAPQAVIILSFLAPTSSPGLLGWRDGWSWPRGPACPTQVVPTGIHGGILSGFHSVWQLKHMVDMRLYFKVLLAWTKWRLFHFVWIQAPCEPSSCCSRLEQQRIWEFYIWSWTFSIQSIKVVHTSLPLSVFFSQICSNSLFGLSQSPGYCHGLHTPIITFGLNSSCRAENGEGQGGTEMFSAAAFSSLVHAFFFVCPTSDISTPPGFAMEIHPNGMTVREFRWHSGFHLQTECPMNILYLKLLLADLTKSDVQRTRWHLLIVYSGSNQHRPKFTIILAKILKTNKSPATDKLTETFPSIFQHVLIKISSFPGPSLWTTLYSLFHMLSKKGATWLLWDLDPW